MYRRPVFLVLSGAPALIGRQKFEVDSSMRKHKAGGVIPLETGTMVMHDASSVNLLTVNGDAYSLKAPVRCPSLLLHRLRRALTRRPP